MRDRVLEQLSMAAPYLEAGRYRACASCRACIRSAHVAVVTVMTMIVLCTPVLVAQAPSATKSFDATATDPEKSIKAAADRAKAEAMLKAAEEGGTRVKPEFGSVWYHLAGPDKEHARGHMTIAVPGATAQSLGLPDKRTQNSIWIMNAGTTTAHLMVPGE